LKIIDRMGLFSILLFFAAEERFQPQRAYVRNIEVECLKHTPLRFETFPGRIKNARREPVWASLRMVGKK